MYCSGVAGQQISDSVQSKATRWTVPHTIGRRVITAFWTIHRNLVLVIKENPSSNTLAKPSQTALSEAQERIRNKRKETKQTKAPFFVCFVSFRLFRILSWARNSAGHKKAADLLSRRLFSIHLIVESS
jgi:hypothetical protein